VIDRRREIRCLLGKERMEQCAHLIREAAFTPDTEHDESSEHERAAEAGDLQDPSN